MRHTENENDESNQPPQTENNYYIANIYGDGDFKDTASLTSEGSYQSGNNPTGRLLRVV